MPKRTTKIGLDAYLRQITFLRDRVADFKAYPFSIPALQNLETLEFHPRVTFFVGEKRQRQVDAGRSHRRRGRVQP